MTKFFQEYLTSIIAVAGLLISIYNFIEARFSNRKNFQLTIEHTHTLQGKLLLIVSIVNKSRLRVTLTSCKLTIGEKEYFVGVHSTIWYTYNDPIKKGRSGEHSVTFPITVDSLGYFFGVLEISGWEDQLPAKCHLQIGTNRGMVHQNCVLPATTDSYKELLQHLK